MTPAIDVFFEFASPYSYLAAQELPALAARHGRPLRWRPIELAKVWKRKGSRKPTRPCGGQRRGYIMRDAARVAADRGLTLVPFRSLPNTAAGASRCPPAEPMRARSGQNFVLEAWRNLFAEGRKSGRSTCSRAASTHVCARKSGRRKGTSGRRGPGERQSGCSCLGLLRGSLDRR